MAPPASGAGEAGVKGKHHKLLHRRPASTREVREPLYLSHPGPLRAPHPLLSARLRLGGICPAFEVPSLLTAPCISDFLPLCLPARGTCRPWPQPRNPSTGQRVRAHCTPEPAGMGASDKGSTGNSSRAQGQRNVGGLLGQPTPGTRQAKQSQRGTKTA